MADFDVGKGKIEQVREAIIERIAADRLREGARIPGECELSEVLGVSRNTVREAIGGLVQEGLLRRRRGSGTYLVGGSGRTGGSAGGRDAFRVGFVVFKSVGLAPTPYVLHVMHGLAEPSESMPRMEITLLGSEPVFAEAGGLHFMDSARHRRVDGFLFSVVEHVAPGQLAELREMGYPVVFLSADYPEGDYPSVRVDLADGYAKVTQRLLFSGRGRIGVVAGRREGRSAAACLGGYVTAHSRIGAACDLSLVRYTEGVEAAIVSAADGLVDAGADAVLCYDDEAAVKLVRHVQARGVRVPEDVAVVGANDTVGELADVPALTTLRLPLGQMGRACRDLFARHGRGEAIGGGSIVFEPQLIIRQSALGDSGV